MKSSASVHWLFHIHSHIKIYCQNHLFLGPLECLLDGTFPCLDDYLQMAFRDFCIISIVHNLLFSLLRRNLTPTFWLGSSVHVLVVLAHTVKHFMKYSSSRKRWIWTSASHGVINFKFLKAKGKQCCSFYLNSVVTVVAVGNFLWTFGAILTGRRMHLATEHWFFWILVGASFNSPLDYKL